MIEIQNEYIVCIDVDQTLIMHHDSHSDGMSISLNPYSGTKIKWSPNENHIELLKQYKGRGLFVIVWSAAGVLWAKTIINALGINDNVDLIMTKPSKYVDDLMGNEILGSRVYLK